MATFETVLDEILDKFPKLDKGKRITVAKFAEKAGINPTLLSRLKNNKATLTDEVKGKILACLGDGSSLDQKSLADERRDDFIDRITSSLQEVQILLNTSKKSGVIDAEKLFEKLAQEKALLIIDYRDLPQAASGGAYPDMGEKLIDAVENGLCLALFQPFGQKLSLSKKYLELYEKIHKISERRLLDHAQGQIATYNYLFNLAIKVEAFYLDILEKLAERSEVKGQVVLYEAAYRDGNDWGVIPSVVAAGIQSRLFYASFLEEGQHKTRVCEWVAGSNDEHFFIERSEKSVPWDIVLSQFNPIPAYWKAKENRLPKNETELGAAYEEFGLQRLLAGENASEIRGHVKWEISGGK